MTTRLNWQSTNNITTLSTNHINDQCTSTTLLDVTLTTWLWWWQPLRLSKRSSMRHLKKSYCQDFTHLHDRTSLSYGMTPWFKPFTITVIVNGRISGRTSGFGWFLNSLYTGKLLPSLLHNRVKGNWVELKHKGCSFIHATEKILNVPSKCCLPNSLYSAS